MNKLPSELWSCVTQSLLEKDSDVLDGHWEDRRNSRPRLPLFPTSLSYQDWKVVQSFRLGCKTTNAHATAILFRHIVSHGRCTLGKGHVARLKALESISRHEHLARHVRHVEIGPCCEFHATMLFEMPYVPSYTRKMCFPAERIATALQGFPRLETLQYHGEGKDPIRYNEYANEEPCVLALSAWILGNVQLAMPNLRNLELTVASQSSYSLLLKETRRGLYNRGMMERRLAGLHHVSFRSIRDRCFGNLDPRQISFTMGNLVELLGPQIKTYQVIDSCRTHLTNDFQGLSSTNEHYRSISTRRLFRQAEWKIWPDLVNLDLSGVIFEESCLLRALNHWEKLRTFRLSDCIMWTQYASSIVPFRKVNNFDIHGLVVEEQSIPRPWQHVLKALRARISGGLLYMTFKKCFTLNDAYPKTTPEYECQIKAPSVTSPGARLRRAKRGRVLVLNHTSCFRNVADLYELQILEDILRVRRQRLGLEENLPALADVSTWRLGHVEGLEGYGCALEGSDDDDDQLM